MTDIILPFTCKNRDKVLRIINFILTPLVIYYLFVYGMWYEKNVGIVVLAVFGFAVSMAVLIVGIWEQLEILDRQGRLIHFKCKTDKITERSSEQ